MVFMIGMYWCARSPETERMKIRGWREDDFPPALLPLPPLADVGSEGLVPPVFVPVDVEVEWLICSRLMWVRARVRAPAMEVVGVKEEGGVVW